MIRKGLRDADMGQVIRWTARLRELCRTEMKQSRKRKVEMMIRMMIILVIKAKLNFIDLCVSAHC